MTNNPEERGVVEVTPEDRDAAASVATQVLHAFRRRDGLTGYIYPENREREERHMRETFDEIVAPLLARRRIASASSGYERGLEDAAKVAERQYTGSNPAFYGAAQGIATAIRALKESAR